MNVPIIPIQPVSMEPVHEYPERHVHPITVMHPPTVIDDRGATNPASVPTNSEVQEFVRKPEEKSSIQRNNPPDPEEKTSGSDKKRKFRYEGEGGRIHTEAQIDEILDFWLMTGELPTYVSNRQRYDYRHHERLPERMELLEQRGIPIVVTVPGTTGHSKNVIPLKRTKVQRNAGRGN